MRATEKLMNELSIKEFISYLEENAKFEDCVVECINGKCVNCKAYDLKEKTAIYTKNFW